MVDIAPSVRHPVDGRTMAELWAAFPQASEPLTLDEAVTRTVDSAR
jgi:2-amino-4-hydroxy-6-hydroxymethyldihydropteridine diphosphokinase